MSSVQQAGFPSSPAFSYPSRATERSDWIVSARDPMARRLASAREPAGSIWEEEWQGGDIISSGLTIFLVNRECPWRCVMCDLWRDTLPQRVEAEDILAQMDVALATRGGREMEWLKLYNAGSFFDSGAIPPSAYGGIARRCAGAGRVVVECHPSLVDDRVSGFQRMLPEGVELEVAMGLETVHPEAHERLNKRTSPGDFARAAARLRGMGVGVRLFLLTRPPFIPRAEALGWLLRSVDFALDAGGDPVVVIPTRPGNGAMERLRLAGEWDEAPLEWLEQAVIRGRAKGGGRVLADTWGLESRALQEPSVGALLARLKRLNRGESGKGPGE